ncbi:hypothetical protein N802_06320 [Knoellia sinensis KCTC 19936]|uniref:Uncharacterized protein n=1 Tax=Knoellia sinensis KCTC 19936 TaxID=1385520 RepID=A0A0A0J4Y2_9MICO|nr:hypothetical protein N802_06320 [Knoellia sinensis KCTC 19936]
MVLAVAAVTTGCTAVEATPHEPLPAVTIVDGADDSAPKTLSLTADAVRRLELTTVVVEDPARVPYSAVLYDKTGKPWVYSNPEERTFIRVPVTITRVEDDAVNLSAGPPRGTRIVTRAAIKLYGAETGVGGGH